MSIVVTNYVYTITTPQGDTEYSYSLNRYSKIHNINTSHLTSTLTGERNHHKNYICTDKVALPADWQENIETLALVLDEIARAGECS